MCSHLLNAVLSVSVNASDSREYDSADGSLSRLAAEREQGVGSRE